jgi:TonB family protein
MRRMILTSLVLLPVMAHAQAGTSTEPQPSTSSAMLHAELTRPTGPATYAASTAAPAASHTAVREFVKTRTSDDFADSAMRDAGTLEYAMMGDIPTEASAPKLTRVVEVQLSEQELAAQPQVANVTVRATIDADGLPRNVAVAHSAGTVLDKRALEAVSQYRFKPATRDNQPVDAPVMITIRIQK